jgi:ADP-ribose pyrophosphatase YjhB (NUDIX family)
MNMEKQVKVGIGVMILKDNKVLLGKRYGDPEENTAKGTWTFPGGKLEFGENIDSSGKREVLEETGMGVGDLELISVTNDISYGNHFITIGFLTNNFEGEPRLWNHKK